MRFRAVCFVLGMLPVSLFAGEPLFDIRLALGETAFPTQLGWFDPPIVRYMTVTNQSGTSMPLTYILPAQYTIDTTHSTCTTTLNQGEDCQLAVMFNPSKLGRFTGKLKICGHHGLWCSVDPIGFDVTVANNDIVSTTCNAIQSRPFSTLDCAGSYAYANNFYTFLSRVLKVTESTPAQHFHYFQHQPSPNETTTACLEARQKGVSLDPLIQGGGTSLCNLMGYATSNSSSDVTTSKQFPPYLTFLLGTEYPISESTEPLSKLSELLATFGHSGMDSEVQHLGYNGYVDFLNQYYLEQANTSYMDCGRSATCHSLYYLPYSSTESTLRAWPPSGIQYWGMSGGGGSGAGYQIEAFKPGSAIHYTLFTGGGGGGGGNTTPEGLNTSSLTLLNTGSGGGGGSQFANCYVTTSGNLNGLGLGSGTGSGLSAIEGDTVAYQAPPVTSYSYYPPISSPSWSHDTILTAYTDNLTYLFNTLIPQLYDDGYTIAVTGGGGGGSGLEFLNAAGEEYQPHPVSIGYGFNFCYAFNKTQKYTATDCISSTNAGSAASVQLDNLIYKNIGTFFNQGMDLAVSTCQGGYSNYSCTCTFQHAYVICELTRLLVANGFTSGDIPTWLVNPHCNDTRTSMAIQAASIDQLSLQSVSGSCATSIQEFYQTQANTTCVVPW